MRKSFFVVLKARNYLVIEAKEVRKVKEVIRSDGARMVKNQITNSRKP